jgi:DNA-binding transcriptional regulator YdaS (Cro superfamily)
MQDFLSQVADSFGQRFHKNDFGESLTFIHRKFFLPKKESHAFIAFMKSALEIAKEKVGGPSGLAKAIGDITPQAVSQWHRVPAERVLAVELATGVARHELRPDIYPQPKGRRGAA